jgi:hypothetical protein
MASPRRLVFIVTRTIVDARLIANDRKLEMYRDPFKAEWLWIPSDASGSVLRGRPGTAGHILIGPSILNDSLSQAIDEAVERGYTVEGVTIPKVRAS